MSSAAWLQSEIRACARLQAQPQIACAVARTSGRIGLPVRSMSLSHQIGTSELLILHHDLLATRVDRRMSDRVDRAASAAILGKTGHESRAEHSNGLQKSPRRLVSVGWTSRFCVPSPQLTGRKGYILNQCTVPGVIFLFPGRDSGQGERALGAAESQQRTTTSGWPITGVPMARKSPAFW